MAPVARWLVGLVGLAALSIAAPARAEAPTLRRMEQLLEELDYPAAIAAGRALLSAGRNDLRSLKRIYELLARSLVATGDDPGATAAFRKLLALQPGYQVGEDVSPKIRTRLAEVIAAWAGRPGLTVAHRPPPRAPCDRPLALEVKVVEDPERMVGRIRLSYTLPGAMAPRTVEAPLGKRALMELPAAGKPGQLRYALEVLDPAQNVLLRLGTPEPITIELHRPDPPPLLAALPARAEPAVELAIAKEKRRLRTRWGYATLGLGAACAATAAVLYGVGIVQGNEGHERYLAARSDEEILRYGEEVDSAGRKLTAGHVLVGVGVAAVAVSVYLLVTRPRLDRVALAGPGLLEHRF